MKTCIIFKWTLQGRKYLILVEKGRPILHFHKPFSIIAAQRNSVIQVSKPYDSAGDFFSNMIRNFGITSMKNIWQSIEKSKKHIHYNFSKIVSNNAYSWSKILSGILLYCVLQIFGNWVFFSISMTSRFRRSSSPSFSPDARWLQIKQKLVW